VPFVTTTKLADELSVPFVETSSKNSTNVEQAFLLMAREIKNKQGACPKACCDFAPDRSSFSLPPCLTLCLCLLRKSQVLPLPLQLTRKSTFLARQLLSVVIMDLAADILRQREGYEEQMDMWVVPAPRLLFFLLLTLNPCAQSTHRDKPLFQLLVGQWKMGDIASFSFPLLLHKEREVPLAVPHQLQAFL